MREKESINLKLNQSAIFRNITVLTLMIMFSLLLRAFSKEIDWVPAAERNLTIYIGWPLESPTAWKRVKQYTKAQLELEDGAHVSSTNVFSYVLAYPNGEYLGGKNVFSPLPPGLKFLEPVQNAPKGLQTLDDGQVAFGKSICQVSHSRFRRNNEGNYVYATTLRNISQQRIRIKKFVGLDQVGSKYRISTVSGDYYSSEQFQSWYAVPQDGWIDPGKQVTDDNNYGSGGKAIWAYFGVTEDGNYFIATVPVPR